MNGWTRILRAPWFPLAAAAAALLLTLPALWNGLELDDYFHRAIHTHAFPPGKYAGGPQDMFRFLHGDPAHVGALMDLGLLPWWTHPEAKAEFLQFLTVQTHVLDYALWPDTPALMHAHSLLWLGVLIVLTGLFYRRILGSGWPAGLAVLLFALEDGHGTPAGWICNRNVLVAATFGVAALIAHDRWRRRDGRAWGVVAVALWACSLCAKEAGIATSAYLAAYALWLDRARWTDRFLSMVPYGVVLVLWRVVRGHLGYGVAHMGLYVDPITDPARFLWALSARYPVLLLGQWLEPPSDVSFVVRRLLGSPLWWWAIVGVGAVAAVLWPVVRPRAEARFFATGMLLAAIPVCATQPMDRLLMFVGIGAFGLMACFVAAVLAAKRQSTSMGWGWRLRAAAAVVLLLIHTVLAAPLLSLRAGNPVGPRRIVSRFYLDLGDDPTVADQDVVVVNPPSTMHAAYVVVRRRLDAQSVPRSVRCLLGGFSPVAVSRPDATTLVLDPEYGFLHLPLDQLFRSEWQPLAVGQRVALRGMTVQVDTTTSDGRPQRVRFVFDRKLEDPGLRWLAWQDGGYRPFVPPPVGKTVHLASPLRW